MIVTGGVYWWKNHPWIIISNLGHSSGDLLIVNLTSLDDECADDECILVNSDYSWIKHPTAVAFSRAKRVGEKEFAAAVMQGQLREGNPKILPVECLNKIRRAALASKQLGKRNAALLGC